MNFDFLGQPINGQMSEELFETKHQLLGIGRVVAQKGKDFAQDLQNRNLLQLAEGHKFGPQKSLGTRFPLVNLVKAKAQLSTEIELGVVSPQGLNHLTANFTIGKLSFHTLLPIEGPVGSCKKIT